MKKKHGIFIVLIFFIIIIIGMFNYSIFSKQETDICMKIAIYPSGMLDETYYFTINDDGIFSSSIGVRKNDDIRANKFLKSTSEYQVRELNSQEMQSLINLAEELQDSNCDISSKIVLDSWDVALLYKGKVYQINYYLNECDILEELIGKIIELSPTNVNLRAFS